jgi:hypothetical protein
MIEVSGFVSVANVTHFMYTRASLPFVGPTQPSAQWVMRLFSAGVGISWSGDGAVPPLPNMLCGMVLKLNTASTLKFNVDVCSVLLSARLFLLFFGATAHRGPGPPDCRGFEITDNDTTQSVGLLWTGDQPVAETST